MTQSAERCGVCRQYKPAMADPRFGNVSHCVACARRFIAMNTRCCQRCKASYMSTWALPRLCPMCRATNRREEEIKMARRLADARSRNLKATLTLDEWMETLQFFRGMCAYCLVKPYDIMEHFVPQRFGGETTKHNCVPACNSCNSLKSLHLPDELIEKRPEFRASVLRVKAYLAPQS